MFYRPNIKLLLSALILCLCSTAQAQNDSPTEQLNPCQSSGWADQSTAHHACYQFVQGFLQGALLTDAAIVDSFSEQSRSSTFFNRALETRVGGRLQALPVTYLARFCLPENSQIDGITKQLTELMLQQTHSNNSSGQRLYNLLKQVFPCNSSEE